MFSNVPQFIDTEDKIVGPLTAKQLGWLAIAGVLLLILWNTLDMSSFLFSAIIIGGIFGALAFYRPYNQPLLTFMVSSVMFAFNPKMYVWKRNYVNIKTARVTAPKNKEIIIHKKTINSEKIAAISKMLDKKTRI